MTELKFLEDGTIIFLNLFPSSKVRNHHHQDIQICLYFQSSLQCKIFDLNRKVRLYTCTVHLKHYFLYFQTIISDILNDFAVEVEENDFDS